ncbi:penicillin-binding protein 2 [Helicobacter sp. T3_23-1059]
MKNIPIPFRITLLIFGVVWILLLLKLSIITIARYDHYEEIARRNMFKQEVLVPARGLILDRQGAPLAVNDLFFGVFLKPLLKENELQNALQKIKDNIQGVDIESLKESYVKQNSAYNHEPIQVVDYVSYDDMQVVYSVLNQHENIIVKPIFKRYYPNGELASHIIGYVGAADKNDVFSDPMSKHTGIIGKEGIERQYNAILQGQLGYRASIVNAFNQKVSQAEEVRPQVQNDITLTIDARLQRAIDEEYGFGEKNGSAIVMDVHNGEILAAGSYPEYDLNDFVGGISIPKWNALRDNPHKPLINRFINGQYPPGSVIKMGIAMSILEFGNIDENTKVVTPYSIVIGNHHFRDWKAGGHGSADAFKAIRESVDVYFYKMSQVVGVERMTQVLHQMGFGQKSGLDFPGESNGILPTPHWKAQRYGAPWFAGDTVQTSIGQGYFLTTPMQIARYTALIASGKLPTPHFIKQQNVEDITFESKDVLNDFQKSKLWVLQKGMVEACNAPGGTGTRRLMAAKVKVGCKTGTAQVSSIAQDIKVRIKESELEYFKRSHGWMTAFVPSENPQYAITILIEHGQSGGNAGPIVVRIVNELYKLGYIK